MKQIKISNNLTKKMPKILIYIFFLLLLIIIVYVYNDYQVRRLINTLSNKIDYTETSVDNYLIKNTKLYQPISIKEKKYLYKTGLIGFSSGVVQNIQATKTTAMISVNGICYSKKEDSKKIRISMGKCNGNTVDYTYKPYEQLYIVPKTGTYKIHLWGVSGGHSANLRSGTEASGKGAYVSGNIKLNKGDVLFLQVGSAGENGQVIKDQQLFTSFGYASIGGTGGYNGGGNGYNDPQQEAAGGGGGATDVRIKSGNWDDFNSLKSRIIVAAGGGGMSRHYLYDGTFFKNTGISGSGGTINGIDAVASGKMDDNYGRGATQTIGYAFGKGQNGSICMTSINGLGGGASGYMGSKSGYCQTIDWIPSTGAGGGSSFVSGCKKCNAISEKSTVEKIEFTNQPNHYSNLVFSDIKMLSGDNKVPTYDLKKDMVGNVGNGYVKIQYLGK